MEIRSSLPVHPVPHSAVLRDERLLYVVGLVQQPLVLDLVAMADLPRTSFTEPFTCEEGWSVPGLRWGGVRLVDILALAHPLPGARYVRVIAGSYVLPIPLAEAELALLCDQLNGQPLAGEHGAPWRLVVPGAACYASVKWVERLELASGPGDNSARALARARLVSK